MVGLGCLTRYAFGWLILPVGIWISLYGGRNRSKLMLAAAGAFCVLVGPWIVRNYVVSGTPFGTAGYAVYQGTSLFPGDQLPRTLVPSFSGLSTQDFGRKFWINAREIVANEIPRLGGSWVIGLFMVGLLLPFRNLTRVRIRYWLLFCFVTLFVVEAFGRTGLEADSPLISSDNLLVLLAPLIFVYGVSLFFTLIEPLTVAEPGGRWPVWTLFGVLACAPFLVSFLAPRASPVAYPPYYPPWTMAKCGLVDRQALVMADIPWAVAWYGNRQSVWLTLKHRGQLDDKASNDFYAVNRLKAVTALYLTAKTLKTVETSAIWQWANNVEPARDWVSFALGTYLKGEVPDGFPLRVAPEGLGPEIFLTDSER